MKPLAHLGSIAAIGAVLGVLLTPGTAAAFCRSTTCNVKKETCERDEAGCVTTGTPLHWDKHPLVYRFHTRGSSQLVREEARAAVRAAFHRWSDVVCPAGGRTSLRFDEGEDIDEDKPLEAGARAAQPFGIYFRDLGWPYVGEDETLAKTNTIYGKKSGVIEYADIEVNTTRRFSLVESGDAIDLQAVITHEVGHYIGLAHSREPQAIMVESYCNTDDRCEKGKVAARRLAPDDIAAVCALFPPDGATSSATSAATSAEADDEDAPAPSSCATTPARQRGQRGQRGPTLVLACAFAAVAVAAARRARSRAAGR